MRGLIVSLIIVKATKHNRSELESAISGILFLLTGDNHSSKRRNPDLSQRVATFNFSAKTRSLFGLAPAEVYQAITVTHDAGELLPHRFTLTSRSLGEGWRFIFCGTFSGSPQATVSSRPTLWCPDFPLCNAKSHSDYLTLSNSGI